MLVILRRDSSRIWAQSMPGVLKLALSLTANMVLTLQPAAFVGTLIKTIGADMVTPAHEVILGFYRSLILDTTGVAPPACSAVPPHQQADIVLALSLMLSSSCPIIMLAITYGARCHIGPRGRSCLNTTLRLLLRVACLGHGFVCVVVFQAFSGVPGHGSPVLAALVFLAFCLALPAATFTHLYATTSKVVHPILRHYVSHLKQRAWWYRHAWQVFTFLLALDEVFLADQVRADSQIASGILGFFSLGCMSFVLARVSPYQMKFRWIGWTRQLVLLQLAVVYVLKLSGCLCMYGNPNQRPTDFVRALGMVWLVLYIASPVCLLAGFFWCIMVQDDEAMSHLHSNVALQLDDTVEMMDMSVNPMRQYKQHRSDPSHELHLATPKTAREIDAKGRELARHAPKSRHEFGQLMILEE